MRPLDKQRAAALGCSTEPYDALASAVEALGAIMEEDKPDPETVEALEDVIEFILEPEPEEAPTPKKKSAFQQGEGDRSDWLTTGQSFDKESAAEKKSSWELRLKSARQDGKRWPRDVWGREIKSQEAYGKSLYRPGTPWPKKYGGSATSPKGSK